MKITLLNLTLGSLLTIAAVSVGCSDTANDEPNSTEAALKGGKAAASDGGLAKCGKGKSHDHDSGVQEDGDESDGDESDGDDAGDESADEAEGDGGKGYGKGGKTDKAKGGNSGSAKGGSKCVADDGTVVDQEDAAVHGKGENNGQGHRDAGK